MAHISPIIEHFVKSESDPITNLHLISDGRTSQYRNKSYFYLLTQYISERFPQILQITHNYGEAGHGKGPPDGVGGAVKYTCDDAVAHGIDVNNFDAFCEVVENRIESVLFEKLMKVLSVL